MFYNNNTQVNPLGGMSMFAPPGMNSSAYANLLTGTSGLTGMNMSFLPGMTGSFGATGSDSVNIGSEASGLMGGSNANSLSSSLTGGDSTTNFIMQMISKLSSSSNNIAQQLLSGTAGATGTSATGTGTTGSSTTGSAAVTGAGKLDTSGVETKIRKGNGTDHTTGEPILEWGTMKAGVKGEDGTAEITKDYVRADGKPSASNDPKGYKAQTGPVFENFCPGCGKKGTLSYCIGWESPEGSYVCDQSKGGCDMDYSVLGGQEHVTSGNIRYLKKAANAPVTGASGTAATGSATAGSGSTAAGGDIAGASAVGATASAAATATGGANATTVANSLAKEFATYTYQSYSDFKKSNTETESTKSGNCGDMAKLAMAKFKAQGINARVVGGNMQNDHYNGGHYWVQYQDPATGQWKFFDPTPAAITKTADVALAKTYGTYTNETVYSAQRQAELSS